MYLGTKSGTKSWGDSSMRASVKPGAFQRLSPTCLVVWSAEKASHHRGTRHQIAQLRCLAPL